MEMEGDMVRDVISYWLMNNNPKEEDGNDMEKCVVSTDLTQSHLIHLISSHFF